MHLNCDLHIHGRYSGGSSKTMTLEGVARAAKEKGLQLMATGDILHDEWASDLADAKQIDDGTFELVGMRFILTTEVEDAHRVHHLLLFPSMDSRHTFKDTIRKHSVNLDTDGRPNVRLPGNDIVRLAKDADALVGPCHAFTPWTSIYSKYDSLEECYMDNTKDIDFLELGLSADTFMADKVRAHHPLTFLSNSDAHSASPHRLGREYNILEVEAATFEEVKLALARKNGRRFIMNVGMPPQEGKYHLTACINCYTPYDLNEAISTRWKCPECGKRLKKGVTDRINELAGEDPAEASPDHRPPYKYILPLGMIISKVYGVKSLDSIKVKSAYDKLYNRFGPETGVLFDVPLDQIQEETDEAVAWGVEAFRNGLVKFIPGGGGKYGEIAVPERDGTYAVESGPKKRAQKSLGDF